MGNTEQVKPPISSNNADETNNPFETFSTRAIEKITPKTRPMTPRMRLIRPKIVKKAITTAFGGKQ